MDYKVQRFPSEHAYGKNHQNKFKKFPWSLFDMFLTYIPKASGVLSNDILPDTNRINPRAEFVTVLDSGDWKVKKYRQGKSITDNNIISLISISFSYRNFGRSFRHYLISYRCSSKFSNAVLSNINYCTWTLTCVCFCIGVYPKLCKKTFNELNRSQQRRKLAQSDMLDP